MTCRWPSDVRQAGRATMRKIPPVFVAGALAASTLAASREVDALGTPLTLEVAVKSGFGTNIYALGANPLGVGLGGRVGVSIYGFHGGFDGEYFFGGSEDLPLGGVPTHQSAHSVKYGVQVGYNIGIHSITIRPQLGVGNFTQTVDESVAGVSLSSTNRSSLYLEPGVIVLGAFGNWLVGLDANALLITGFSDTDGTSRLHLGFTVHGQVGLSF